MASSHANQCQYCNTRENLLSFRALGVESFQPSLKVSEFCISFGITFSSSIHVSGRTGHGSVHTFNSSCTLLDGGSLASHCSLHVGRCFLPVSHPKMCQLGCFSRPGTNVSAIGGFNPLVAEKCVLHRQGISSNVFYNVAWMTPASMTKVHQHCWKEFAG